MQSLDNTVNKAGVAIGYEEVESMRVDDSNAVMALVTEHLYSNPIKATIQEILTNAWDSHIESNKTDTPILITLTEEFLQIEDSGTGIPHDLMGEIYGVVGKGTKKSKSVVTGEFGLGSKAPWAYTPSFEVISYHNGVKKMYQISRASELNGGKASILTMLTVECDKEKTGITVKVPVLKGDYKAFLYTIQELVHAGDINASLNLSISEPEFEPLSRLGLSREPNSMAIVTGNKVYAYINSHSRLFVRYGSVIYPIPKPDNINTNTNYKEAYSILVNWFVDASRICGEDSQLIIQVPDNCISVHPSRERVNSSNYTLNALVKIMSDSFKKLNDLFIKESAKQLEVRNEAIVSTWINATKELGNPIAPDNLIYTVTVDTESTKGESLQVAFKPLYITKSGRMDYNGSIVNSNESLASTIASIVIRSPIEFKTTRKLLHTYYTRLADSDPKYYEYLSKYTRCLDIDSYHTTRESPYTRNANILITCGRTKSNDALYSVYSRLMLSPLSTKPNLYFFNGNILHSANERIPEEIFLNLMDRPVVLTTSLKNLKERITRRVNNEVANISKHGYVVWFIDRKIATIKEAKNVLESIGYPWEDLTTWLPCEDYLRPTKRVSNTSNKPALVESTIQKTMNQVAEKSGVLELDSYFLHNGVKYVELTKDYLTQEQSIQDFDVLLLAKPLKRSIEIADLENRKSENNCLIALAQSLGLVVGYTCSPTVYAKHQDKQFSLALWDKVTDKAETLYKELEPERKNWNKSVYPLLNANDANLPLRSLYRSFILSCITANVPMFKGSLFEYSKLYSERLGVMIEVLQRVNTLKTKTGLSAEALKAVENLAELGTLLNAPVALNATQTKFIECINKHSASSNPLQLDIEVLDKNNISPLTVSILSLIVKSIRSMK